MSLDIIILAGLAAFLFFKYRSVLGQPPEQQPKPRQGNLGSRPVPGKAKPLNEQLQEEEYDENYPPSLQATLERLRYLDDDFDEKEFVEGSRQAFKMVVEAYAKGDRETLEFLLEDKVYQGFISAIEAREQAGHTLDFTLLKVKDADIIKASIEGHSLAYITVEFVSEQISVLKDATGQPLEGEEDLVEEPVDRWVFRRDMKSRNPNWVLTATEAVQR